MSEFSAVLTRDAKKLKERTPIVPIHRTIDGALNGYSLIKSIFDVQHCTENQNNALDAMHEWMTTPVGLSSAIGISAFFTVLACTAGIEENRNQKTKIGESWKFTREALQAARNGFKAVRGAIFTAAAVTAQNLKYLILPSSLAMSGVYMLNRLYMLKANDRRKAMIKDNERVFTSIMNYGTFVFSDSSIQLRGEHDLRFVECESSSERKEEKLVKNCFIIHKNKLNQEELYYTDHKGKATLVKNACLSKIKAIIQQTDSPHLSLLQLNELLPPKMALRHFENLKKQEIKMIPPSRRRLQYLIRAFNGLIDGLYLYLGVVLLTTFLPQTLLFLTALSAVYCLLCVFSRVYEEYQAQEQLTVTQQRIDLALTSKELEVNLIKLNKLVLMMALETDPIKAKKLEDLRAKLDEKLQKNLSDFETKRIRLRNRSYLSNTETLLLGIKHSLPFYGALISFVFALSFVGFMTGFTIPATLVFGFIVAGIPMIIGGVIHAFQRRKQPSPDLAIEDQKRTSAMSETIHRVKASFKLIHGNEEEEHKALIESAKAKEKLFELIIKSLQADPLADTFYADTAEVIRSFWAGLSKGRKAIEMLLNRLQERDETGHYQDTRIMCFIMTPVAVIYAAIYTMNAFVKGFTRKENTEKNEFQHQRLNVVALEKKQTTQTTLYQDIANIDKIPLQLLHKKTSAKYEYAKNFKNASKPSANQSFGFFSKGRSHSRQTSQKNIALTLSPSESEHAQSQMSVEGYI